jgi:hypothetical protein
MAPRLLLEDLSPPPAWLRFAENFFSPGEALRFATGCCARTEVGVEESPVDVLPSACQRIGKWTSPQTRLSYVSSERR